MIEAELGVGILPASAACPSHLHKIAIRGASLGIVVGGAVGGTVGTVGSVAAAKTDVISPACHDLTRE